METEDEMAAHLDEIKVVEQYDAGQSMSAIAIHFDTTIPVVYDILRKHKIKPLPTQDSVSKPKVKFHRRKEREIDEQQIVQQYQKGDTVTKLSLQYRISTEEVRNILTSHDIEIRRKRNRRKSKPKKELDEAQIIKEYNSGDGLLKMAARYDTIAPTIREILVRHGITIRRPGKIAGK
jgi:Mor family transcriptional regulator